MPDLLNVNDLKVEFHVTEGVVRAVNGVSFRVPAGKTVALVGESGSGKSVVSQAIMGILPKSAKITGGDIISDAAMRTAMHAVLDKSRSVGGVPTTLASLGYDYISMDDGWQQCNCSTHQDIDPTLPSCSIGECSPYPLPLCSHL